MPTGYFLRLAGLFTQSPGNLCHRGHTCTVSETQLELHSGTNQPRRPHTRTQSGPAGLAWLQGPLALGTTGLVSPCQTRRGDVCMCVCVVVYGGSGRGIPAATFISFLPVPFFFFFSETYFGNMLVQRSISNSAGTHWHVHRQRGSFNNSLWPMTAHR